MSFWLKTIQACADTGSEPWVCFFGTVGQGKKVHRLTRNERRFPKILLERRGIIIEPVHICLNMSTERDFAPHALRNLVWRLRIKIGAEAVFSSRDMGYMLR